MLRSYAGVITHVGIGHMELFRIGIPNNKSWILKEVRTTSLTSWGSITRIYINGQILWEISVQRHTTPLHINQKFPAGTEIIFETEMYTAFPDIISACLVVDET
jgi:hypothetical protein